MDLGNFQNDTCQVCEKKIDLKKEVEGVDITEDEDGELYHIKCQLKRGFNRYCPECKNFWVEGQETEDNDGNTYYACPECRIELEDAKPKLKDFKFEARHCICKHTELQHKYNWETKESRCIICSDEWKLEER